MIIEGAMIMGDDYVMKYLLNDVAFSANTISDIVQQIEWDRLNCIDEWSFI